jgi:citrate synthase
MLPTEIGDDAWLSSDEVARRLGVKKATVYAYVSRGLLNADRSGRKSRFRLSDVESLLARIHPGDSRAAQAASRVFQMLDGQPTYRGQPALELARTRTFEEVAQLLWMGKLERRFAWPRPNAHTSSVVAGCLGQLPDGVMMTDKLMVAVSVIGALDRPGSTYHAPEVVASSRQLLTTMIEAFPQLSEPISSQSADDGPGASSPGPFAAVLWSRLSPRAASPAEVRLLEMALILAAEHGLAAPSTTVARTAASLGATVYGVVAAGIGAGTGDVHGSSALIVEEMLRRLRGSPQAMRGLVEMARFQGRVPGFGHRAYPTGDVRAAFLLDRMAEVAGDSPRFAEVQYLRQVMHERGLPPANNYLALATLAHCYDMAPGSTEAMFMIGRSVGWIAHAVEEYARKGLHRIST